MKQINYKSLTAGPVIYRNEKQKAQAQGMHWEKHQGSIRGKNENHRHCRNTITVQNKVITTAILVTELKIWETASV